MTGPACACAVLRKAARAISRVYDEAMAPTGLTTAQFSLLRHLARAGAPPLTRLAEALVMDRTSLYRTLQPLVRDGLVEVAPGKGRAKRAVLTEAGRARIEIAAPHWDAAQQAFLDRYGAKDWMAIDEALKRVVEVAGADKVSPPSPTPAVHRA